MPVGNRVIWVPEGGGLESALSDAFDGDTVTVQVQALLAGGVQHEPDTIVVELTANQAPYLRDLATRVSARTRLIGVGDPRNTGLDPGTLPLDCVLFGDPDEDTLRTALAGGPSLDLDTMLSELLPITLIGGDLETSLTNVVSAVARAFGVDGCLLVMTQESTCYSAQELTPEILQALMPLCEVVCQVGTAVVAPPRPDRPYRSFLGVPIAQDNAPPVAHLLLCRTTPVVFDRHTRRHLASLTRRLARDLPWRLAQERLHTDARMRDMPRVDPVLGVANRTSLDDELPQLVARSERVREPFSVAIIDVDGLRLTNERRGYPAGDAVLAHVAQYALKNTRAVDLVARYAGDSIAVVLPGVDAEGAKTTLTQILSEIDAEPVVHEGKPINLTVSAGIAEVHYDRDTGELALARAMAARRGARVHGEVIAIADAALVADAPSPADFAIGTTLGGVYQIRHEVSRGAFGVVYRAEDMALGRQVALKLLRTDLSSDEAFVDRFRSEAATLARIRNPNLVQVYAFGKDGDNVFFAMELVEGQSLQERVESARKRMRHLPIPEVLSTLEQVASALDALHQAGMLHRDVKPDNVLIDRIHRRCVLIDVGIAVRLGGDKLPAGTPGFTAPEVFSAVGESPATDVYSLGVLAYVLLVLGQPFGGWTALEILDSQIKKAPVPPTQLRPDLPPALDRILLAALDPDPERRPQSARGFVKMLSDLLAPSATNDRARVRSTIEPPMRKITNVVSSPSIRVPPETQRRSSRNASPAHPSTRGVLFRAVYEVLGARRGTALISDFKRSRPDAALALGAQSAPLSWHPTPVFISVLESLSDSPRERHTLAQQIGRAAAIASFPQFFGADITSLTPEQALNATDNLWRCYHNWGTAWVRAASTAGEITLKDVVPHALVCATTTGLLAGILARIKARDAQVVHRSCAAENAAKCVFELTWSAAR